MHEKSQPLHKHTKQQIQAQKNILPLHITDPHQTEIKIIPGETQRAILVISEDASSQMHTMFRECIPGYILK